MVNLPTHRHVTVAEAERIIAFVMEHTDRLQLAFQHEGDIKTDVTGNRIGG